MAHSPAQSVDSEDKEPIIDPEIPIIDAHHHLWDHLAERYLADELLADLTAGHNIVSTVFVQCRAMYRLDASEAMAVVGETEFVNGVAAMFASGLYGPMRPCSAIVGRADLTLGAAVEEVLHAHIAAGGGRFRGIRDLLTWDASPAANPPFAHAVWSGKAYDAKFREGFGRLAPLGLTYDAWQYHTQLQDIVDLAKAFPDTGIVINHCGTPVGIGPYAGRRAEIFEHWKPLIFALADCPNIVMKLGGLGMHYLNFDFDRSQVTSTDLAEAWRPYLETCIEAFDPARCMFESNFPVDGHSGTYRQSWNALKRVAGQYSPDEKALLFKGTAETFYRMG